jgi:hypothetical protein
VSIIGNTLRGFLHVGDLYCDTSRGEANRFAKFFSLAATEIMTRAKLGPSLVEGMPVDENPKSEALNPKQTAAK